MLVADNTLKVTRYSWVWYSLGHCPIAARVDAFAPRLLY